MTGEFQWYYPHDTLLAVASEARTVRRASAAHPQSESARAEFCRPYGLHAEQNPYHRIPGKAIDTWLISTGACFKSIGTGFSKGLSHYFYGNILDSNNPWGTTISFGKITSQDVYKDICLLARPARGHATECSGIHRTIL
eukprot:scaffold4010_cov98-Phaeocystis_antarctica.AAC.2